MGNSTDNVGAWMPALLALGGCRQPRGKVAELLLLQLTVLPSLAQVQASIGPAQLSEGLGAEDGTPIPQVLPGESF